MERILVILDGRLKGMELWGGVKRTVNRVGDNGCDQTELSGHNRRGDDLKRFADLGLAALRYPLL